MVAAHIGPTGRFGQLEVPESVKVQQEVPESGRQEGGNLSGLCLHLIESKGYNGTVFGK
jgi:hypothetical protein